MIFTSTVTLIAPLPQYTHKTTGNTITMTYAITTTYQLLLNAMLVRENTTPTSILNIVSTTTTL
jgi:hypothetical protein